MTRSEGVNTDGEEKCLVGVKMILHILCSAERCMIRKSSSLSRARFFPLLSFHSLTLLVLSSADITVKAFYYGIRMPVNGLTLNGWSCT